MNNCTNCEYDALPPQRGHCNGCWAYNKWTPIKESKLKTTITLRELIEQGACKEGVLWILDRLNRGTLAWRDSITHQDGEDNYFYNSLSKILIKRLVGAAKEDGHPDYITWLKDHGYQTEDNQTEKDSIRKEIAILNIRLNNLE